MESWGQLSPGSVIFPVGSTVGYQATELISTCSGINGPYVLLPATMTYSSPLVWNGSTIRSTGATHQMVSFEDEGIIVLPTCQELHPPMFDEGPATAFNVQIQTVDLPNDLIRIQLTSGQMSVDGDLKVTLRSTTGSDLRTISMGPAGTGTHIFDFGDLATYPANTKVASVYAEWKTNGQTKTASYPYVFTALGLYRQTCYITPLEQDYPAFPTAMVGTTRGPDACIWTIPTFRAGFLTAANRNGNGRNLAGESMQREGVCMNAPATVPAYCAANICARYRVPTPIRTSCGNAPTIGLTVARHFADNKLACGDQVFIEGMGTRAVQDIGDFEILPALDHYRGVGLVVCNGWPNANRPLFRLGS